MRATNTEIPGKGQLFDPIFLERSTARVNVGAFTGKRTLRRIRRKAFRTTSKQRRL
jgi:hypothetical protein